MTFGRNIQKTVEYSLHVQFSCTFAILSTFLSFNTENKPCKLVVSVDRAAKFGSLGSTDYSADYWTS